MKHMSRLWGLGMVATAMAFGDVSLASAQQTIAGNWAPIMDEDRLERGGGPAIADYSGLPITEAGRLRAETWSPSILTVPEHQCKPHPSTYGFRGGGRGGVIANNLFVFALPEGSR